MKAPHVNAWLSNDMNLQDNVVLGKKLAQGGFGTVYRGELLEDNGKTEDVVIKKVSCQSCALLPLLLDKTDLGITEGTLKHELQIYA